MTNVPFLNSITNEMQKRKLKSDVVANALLDISIGNEKLDDVLSMQSSASEIDAVANVVNQQLTKIHQKIRQANNGIKQIVYAVVGDSTRSVDSSEWEIFYPNYLGMIGLTYFNNADPSQTVHDWKNNIDQNTMQQLIDSSIGADGEDTIVEFSMGLNDYTLYGNKADTKESIKSGILAYLAVKPKANLFLVSPPYAQNDERRNALKEIYEELATELNLFLLDGHIPTASLNLSSDYYLDGTHPNAFGAMRMLYWILSNVVPNDVVHLIKADEYTQPINKESLNATTVLNGLYDGNGIYFNNSNYRCLQEFTIDEIRRLNVLHGGNRIDMFFFDANNNLIQKKFATSANNGYVYPPIGTKYVRVNISTSGATWDALSITPSITYYRYLRPFISFKELTSGLKTKITCNYTKDGKVVDYYGNVGDIGQVLTIDANNKMKWS